ncbi:DUF6338 family protein [Microbacterium oleivorans]|uniref:Uncharacterized protein n=1 Tax=Microbacterium oleivorans TaxID=273677 RepID=A0A4R5YL64_9MICO|nr:DUF6338 family protein [Microbacterium oleivorans]TDL45292.1 hypothetical protein E2R54_02170 [Microbacterium oleivorans]
MDIPTSGFTVAAFVVVALPGLILVGIGRWARGESAEDRDVGLSIARGSVFAITLTSLYLLILGESAWRGVAAGAEPDTLVISDTRALALTVLGLYILIPAAVALLLNMRHVRWLQVTEARWLRVPRSRHGYTMTPTPWDHAARRHQASWVKVRKSSGQWVGGWVTRGSFASAYPEPRAIYIDTAYQMTSDGNIGQAMSGTGIYVTIGDDDVVIWIDPTRDDTEGKRS